MVALSTLLNASSLSPEVPSGLFVTAIVQHSSQVDSGALFFAFEGLHTSGAHWAKEAEERGAVAVIAEKPIEGLTLPVIVVPRIRSVYSTMCAAFWGNPERDLSIIGVTGTDGKSTTCDYLHQLFSHHAVHCGLLSTISIDDGSGKVESPWRQSTPEADQLFAFLAQCRDNGVETVVLECTSHALSESYDRLGPIALDAAVVTTFGSEHLDFHIDQQAYLQAKLRIIERLKPAALFISSTENAALDAFTHALGPDQRPLVAGRTVAYAIGANGWEGTTIEFEGQEVRTSLLLPALATNALLAHLGVSALLGQSFGLHSLASLTAVKGRMQLEPNELGIKACIDFAHTPDAYTQVFAFAQAHSTGRILAVLGAAGERDRSKRATMGSIASHSADLILLTEEDPRGEDPQQIYEDLMGQMDGKGEVLLIDDRRKAIQMAVQSSKEGDTLLFLGKGHERTIQRPDGPIAWDEAMVVQAALRAEERKRCV